MENLIKELKQKVEELRQESIIAHKEENHNRVAIKEGCIIGIEFCLSKIYKIQQDKL